jgi:hypothetical protein
MEKYSIYLMRRDLRVVATCHYLTEFLQSKADVNGIFATLHADVTRDGFLLCAKVLRLFESRSSNILDHTGKNQALRVSTAKR